MQNFEDIFAALNQLDPEIQALLTGSIAHIQAMDVNELSRAIIVLAAIATARSCDGMPQDDAPTETWQAFIIGLSALLISVAGQQPPIPIPEPHEVLH